MMAKRRYNMTLGSNLESDLTEIAAKLHVGKSEVLRRALVLFKAAVNAAKVTLVMQDDTEQVVMLK